MDEGRCLALGAPRGVRPGLSQQGRRRIGLGQVTYGLQAHVANHSVSCPELLIASPARIATHTPDKGQIDLVPGPGHGTIFNLTFQHLDTRGTPLGEGELGVQTLQRDPGEFNPQGIVQPQLCRVYGSFNLLLRKLYRPGEKIQRLSHPDLLPYRLLLDALRIDQERH